jgi:aerobic carbon-monoxide dehydrogenase medium subunit
MIPAAFAYHRPSSLEDALRLLARHGEEARVVAGGHSLIPMMKLRLARPEYLIDLQDVEELRGIRSEPNSVIIGAMTTQHELIGSTLLAEKFPIVRETSLQIADPQVRYCGTLGGNLVNGDPGNDMPAVMLALDATYRLKRDDTEREVVARDFYHGAFSTALRADEILVSICLPVSGEVSGFAYEKQKRKVGHYATAAAAVVLRMVSGTCTSAAIALTNVADTPLLAKDAANALLGTALDDAAISEAVRRARAITNPSADGHGSVEFRTHVAGVMVRRAVVRAKERAV